MKEFVSFDDMSVTKNGSEPLPLERVYVDGKLEWERGKHDNSMSGIVYHDTPPPKWERIAVYACATIVVLMMLFAFIVYPIWIK